MDACERSLQWSLEWPCRCSCASCHHQWPLHVWCFFMSCHRYLWHRRFCHCPMAVVVWAFTAWSSGCPSFVQSMIEVQCCYANYRTTYSWAASVCAPQPARSCSSYTRCSDSFEISHGQCSHALPCWITECDFLGRPCWRPCTAIFPIRHQLHRHPGVALSKAWPWFFRGFSHSFSWSHRQRSWRSAIMVQSFCSYPTGRNPFRTWSFSHHTWWWSTTDCPSTASTALPFAPCSPCSLWWWRVRFACMVEADFFCYSIQFCVMELACDDWCKQPCWHCSIPSCWTWRCRTWELTRIPLSWMASSTQLMAAPDIRFNAHRVACHLETPFSRSGSNRLHCHLIWCVELKRAVLGSWQNWFVTCQRGPFLRVYRCVDALALCRRSWTSCGSACRRM